MLRVTSWRKVAMHSKSFAKVTSILRVIFIAIFIFDLSVCAEEIFDENGTCDVEAVHGSQQSISCASAGNTYTHEINVIITFTNAQHNTNLQSKFGTTVSSLFQHSSIPVTLYIIGDDVSQKIAKDILEQRVVGSQKYRVS
jgi:hypothetical protein